MPWTVITESQYNKSRLFRNEYGRFAVRAFTRTECYYVFIDQSSYDIVKDYRWSAAQHGKRGNMRLAVTQKAHKQIYMQWLIFMHYCPDVAAEYVDHLDGDKLNNELSNLTNTTRGCPGRLKEYYNAIRLHESDVTERR